MPESVPKSVPADAALTVAGLSEAQLLARIFPRLAVREPGGAPETPTSLLLGPGDDAAIVAAPDGRTVLSIDTQVADQDFRLEWNNGYRTTGLRRRLEGRRAKPQRHQRHGRPVHVPGGEPDDAAGDPGVLGGGLRGRPHGRRSGNWAPRAARWPAATSAAAVNCPSASRSSAPWTAASRVLRSGARPGDTVALAGTVGRAAAGLALLESDVRVDALDAGQRALLDTQCRPAPPLAAGPAAREAGASAMMDISDGLVRDGNRMAAASHAVLNLDPAALKALAVPLLPASELLGTDPMSWVLGGGEDHGLLAAFPPGRSAPSRFHCDRLGRGPCTNAKHGREHRGQAR